MVASRALIKGLQGSATCIIAVKALAIDRDIQVSVTIADNLAYALALKLIFLFRLSCGAIKDAQRIASCEPVALSMLPAH